MQNTGFIVVIVMSLSDITLGLCLGFLIGFFIVVYMAQKKLLDLENVKFQDFINGNGQDENKENENKN